MKALAKSAQHVQDVLIQQGYRNQVIELPDSTRTAQEAADTIGCQVSQIAKSIIFRIKEQDAPLLVIASGTNRVNEKKIAQDIQHKLGKADADFVRDRTGFVIGGVSPIAHEEKIFTIIDEDLLQYETIWAAAGHPKAVFQLTPQELIDMTGGQVQSIT